MLGQSWDWVGTFKFKKLFAEWRTNSKRQRLALTKVNIFYRNLYYLMDKLSLLPCIGKIDAIVKTQLDRYAESPGWLKEREDWEIGIDEAGRGPVLGPMVYGCAIWPSSHRVELAKIGFGDSKQLNEKKRNQLYEAMKKLKGVNLDYEFTSLGPAYLSEQMLSKSDENLNSISHKTALNLIKSMCRKGYPIKHAYLDTVGPPEKYKAWLEYQLKDEFPGIGLTVCSKADDLFPVCGASSIVAKCERDYQVENWEFPEVLESPDTNFGSGYPADPYTKAWLQNNLDRVFGYPSIVRWSWSTVVNVMGERRAKKIDVEAPDLDEDGNNVVDYDEEGEEFNKTVTKKVKAFVDYDFDHAANSVLNVQTLKMTADS